MSSVTLKAGIKTTNRDVVGINTMSDSSPPESSSSSSKTHCFDSVGLYGMILISEYLVQLCCTIINRFDVDRIVNNLAKKSANAQAAGDCEKGTRDTSTSGLLNPDCEVSIAVVGYREDEQAWRHCLRSLQTQTLRPKCVIGVVDGDEKPDLSMARAFVNEFESLNASLIHLPILLPEHYLVGRYQLSHEAALSLARQAVVQQVLEWDAKRNISSLKKAVYFSQPHGHKRTAMFTAFAMNLYALRTWDAIFTTDSDTPIKNDGLDEMLALLRSAPDIGGVTADVKIWNRAESLLARMCSARYWFAFNIERACQSLWRCVGCLSGPISMYRASSLEVFLGPWNLQTFGGKVTTFGDDRHLTNQLLGHGLKTRCAHRTWCDSESPTSFVLWVAQQTRWIKSFFRETFWFPASFSVLAVLISWDLWLLLFSCYGFIYFFGLLPSKIYALFTMNQTGWGTSARSSSERKRGQAVFGNPLCFLIGAFALVPSALLYWNPSNSLGGLKATIGGLFGGKKQAPDTSTRSSDTMIKTPPAMSVKDMTDAVETLPKPATAS
ncbi:hyaluronan synthase 2 [Thelonectria olida]|uniref:Hyaluronan synthase 2 n=1 Tax=Thelonectria olida TaxID=1576542 RepID=A0A9P8VWA0_9HYPO|nr:hyaluronan synthase 2 [Thelonectria olida]